MRVYRKMRDRKVIRDRANTSLLFAIEATQFSSLNWVHIYCWASVQRVFSFVSGIGNVILSEAISGRCVLYR